MLIIGIALLLYVRFSSEDNDINLTELTLALDEPSDSSSIVVLAFLIAFAAIIVNFIIYLFSQEDGVNNITKAFCLISNIINIDNEECLKLHNYEVQVHYCISAVVFLVAIAYSLMTRGFGNINSKVLLGIGVVSTLAILVFLSTMVYRLIKNTSV